MKVNDRNNTKHINKGILIISVSIAIVFFILSFMFFQEIFEFIDNYLSTIRKVTVINISRLIVSLSLGCIPLCSFLTFRLLKMKAILSYFNIFFATFISYIFILILGHFIASKIGAPSSPLLPKYIIYEPFNNYWGVIVFIASCSFLIFVSVIKKIRVKK